MIIPKQQGRLSGDQPDDDAGLRGQDKNQGSLQDQKDASRVLPEGLKRERKAPLGTNSGRRDA